LKQLFTFSLLLTLLVSGCSFKGLVYRNLDWFVLRNINSYFDQTDQQEETFEPKIRQLVTEMKQTALPRIIALGEQVQAATEDKDFDTDEWRAMLKGIAELRKDLMTLAAKDVGRFLASISAEQWQGFAVEVEEEQNDWLKELTATDDFQDELEDKLDNSFERYNRWLGPLTTKQKELIKGYWPQTQAEAQQWLERRQAQQKLFINLAQGKKAKEIETFLTAWAKDYELLKKKAWGKKKNDQRGFIRFLTTLRSTFTSEQTQHLHDKITELLEDLRSLN
jgi:hypothetical protein